VPILLACLMILICIAAAAFFSGAETALVVADRIRLRHLVEKGHKRALIVDALLHRPEKFLGTTLVGTNLAIVGGSVVATKLISQIIGRSSHWGALVETLIMTLLVLIFSEIIPKNFSRAHADSLVLSLAPWVRMSYLMLYPIVMGMTSFSHLIFRRQPTSGPQKIPFVSREEMRYLTGESHRYGFIEKQEKFIVHQIFNFAETTVGAVMVPLEKAVTIELNSLPEQVSELIGRAGKSRIPVFQDQPNNVLGVVDINHLLTARRNTPLKKLIYPLSRVGVETSIERLFLQLQKKHEHMALVTNQRGKVVGIVTMEDVLEKIVGEIEDEHDEK